MNNIKIATNKEVTTPPRMRGIKQAIKELKAIDKDTAFTEKALRRLIISGSFPSVRIGAKYLIDFDLLCTYLKNGMSCGGSLTELNTYGSIRKIAE